MTERPKQNETPEQKPDEQPRNDKFAISIPRMGADLQNQAIADLKALAGTTTFATGGIRNNKGKPRVSKVHRSVLYGIAEVTDKSSIENGGEYPDNNYKKGLPQTSLADSGIRHVLDYLAGIDIDPKSGIHTLKHALWNFALMVEQLETHPELDDRFHKGGK